MDESAPQKPKRRPRYKGTHPRKFHEKYKELNPERYADELQKIKARGTTPVGTHRPICLTEVLEILKPKPGETALDATLGYGGHTQAILERVLPGGRLVALDQDPIERPKTSARLRAHGFDDKALIIGAINFSGTREFLQQQKIENVDMILADLGLSSMQIDDPSRGFTFKQDGPFDLRMNPSKGESAAEVLARLTAEELQEILSEYSDEPHARQIASALVKQKPRTTTSVAAVVRETMKQFSPKIREREGDTPIRRVFQALRIVVNDEFAALDRFLADLPYILAPRGRVAILSFHSGEDRRVKKAFQAGLRSGAYREIAADIIRPSFEEQRDNPRSKSAKLRWAVR
jgi:16S rRNA (cytosine1402-N4)-methyltransferase